VREVESCPHRAADAAGSTACGLLRALTGLGEIDASRVGRDACRACCEHPLPSAYQINPVIASLVSRVAEQAIADGGRPGCGIVKAADLKHWADGQLVEVHAARGPAAKRGGARATRAVPTVAAIVVCSRPGETLSAVIESVLCQSLPAHEIAVVDAIGDDAVEAEARRFQGAGVKYLRGASMGVLEAWRAGLDLTESEILCFLESGDVPPADYLERGLALFAGALVGIVYSDVEYVGERAGRTFAQPFGVHALERYAYVHPASLVRRQALEISDALSAGRIRESNADWVVWRRVTAAGWHASKQTAVFRTRRHPEGEPRLADERGPSHFERASLAASSVSIFTALSGRTRLWDGFAAWLQAQTWPRAQCRLILMDTSGAEQFGRQVRQFLASCDYPDIRYIAQSVAQAGLADLPRIEHLSPVRLACARIYNRMAREVATPFLLVVEDDIVPPAGVIDRLMRGIDSGTAAVVAPYRSRLHGGYVVWNDRSENLGGGTGLEHVGGAGFGCILLRREVLVHETFRYGGDEPLDFDRAFCRRLRQDRWTIKVDWSQLCEHRHHAPGNGDPRPDQGETE
jgi:hypothetical protein